MKNSEKFKKELEKINTPEELIAKTTNKINDTNYQKNTKYIKPAFALLCTLVISLVIGKKKAIG